MVSFIELGTGMMVLLSTYVIIFNITQNYVLKIANKMIHDVSTINIKVLLW